jgi:hypothetical protein
MTLALLLSTWLTLSPSGDRLSVDWDSPGEVMHFDAHTGRLLGKQQARAAPALAGRYRIDRFAGTLTFLTPVPPRTIKLCREPFAAAADPGGRALFVACLLPEQASTAPHIAARVVVVDTATGAVERSILLPNGSTGVRGIATSPDGRWAFVTHILARYTVHTSQIEQGWINTNAVSILDVPGRKLHATFLLDDVDNGAANPWAVAVSADSKRLFVTHAGTHELSVIDIPALLYRVAEAGSDAVDRLSFLMDIRERIPLPGKGPRAIAVSGGKVWVAEYFSRTIALVEDGRARPFASAPSLPPSRLRLGEMRFHDASFCMQRWQSCSTCHPDARVDGLNWDLLNDGLGNPKNTRTLLNAHQAAEVMWTGVRPSAANAVRAGISHILFAPPSETEAQAIDAWLRSLKPARLPGIDHAAAARGRKVFVSAKAGCAVCHPPPLYTDGVLHDVGTHGRADFTDSAGAGREAQRRFKTPSLVEVWRTAPYLHDGRYATLEEAVRTGHPGDRRGDTSSLTKAELRDLIEFLRSL